MPFARSYFNHTLFKKNMTRFWPIWAIYLIIWIVALPANLLLNWQDSVAVFASQEFARSVPLEMLGVFSIGLSAVFSIFAAMAVFSYVCNSRSACLMHSLPIRREGLFLTNYLSGLSFFVLPNILIFFLTLMAEAICGYVDVGVLLTWLLGTTLLPLFFYSFAVFCAMFTGHLLALPVFYGILNWLCMLLAFLINSVLSGFVFGYSSTGSIFLNQWGEWFTPCINLYLTCRTDVEWNSNGVISSVSFSGLPYLFLYGGIGLLFAVAALFLYRKRRMERAGEVVTVTPLRPVFKYGFAFCTALSLGALLYAIFEEALPRGAWTLLGFMLFCGIIGYFAAEMMLQKSFRVFSKWKGCVVFLLCLTIITAAVDFDLFGYEQKVPDISEIASVRLDTPFSTPYDNGSNASLVLTDPELIQQVVAIQAQIIADKTSIEAALDQSADYYEASSLGFSIQDSGTTSFTISYTLKSGRVFARTYTIPINSDDLQDPDSYASRLQALVSDPSVTADTYFSDLPENAKLLTAQIDYYNDGTSSFSTVTYSDDEAAALLEAVREDMAAGNLGRRYLLETEERYKNCYFNNITFSFTVTEITYFTANGMIQTTSSEHYYDVTITLQTSAAKTLALLGAQKDGLITMAEYERQIQDKSF